MGEPRRIELITTTSEPLHLSKPKEKKRLCTRFTLSLTDSTEEIYPEFSYLDLQRKCNQEASVNGDNNDLVSKSKDPFSAKDAAEHDKMAALARSYEVKYGKAGHGKRRKFDRVQDLVDLGDGYDESDGFIDNSEAYDEIVPACMETKHKGFYINSGQLDFSIVSGDESADEINSIMRKRKRLKKKKMMEAGLFDKRKKSFTSSDMERFKKKRKLLNGVQAARGRPRIKPIKSAGQIRKPSSKNDSIHTSTAPLSSAAVTPVNSTHKSQQATTSLVDATPVTPAVSGGCNLSKDAHQQLSTISHSNTHTPAGTIVADIMSPDGSSMDSVGGGANNGGTADVSRADSTPGNLSLLKAAAADEGVRSQSPHPENAPKLPEKLDASIVKKIDILKQAAQNFTGKAKFFTPRNNSILLEIDSNLRSMSGSVRQCVYSHLAAYLPVGKATLLARVKKLRQPTIDAPSDQTSVLRLTSSIESLKKSVQQEMPKQLQRYQEETKAARERSGFNKESETKEEGGSTESEEDDKKEGTEPKKRFKAPNRKFKFTEKIRSLLFSIVQKKLESCKDVRNGSKFAEDYLMEFFENEIKPLWPKGWIRAKILYKETRSVHQKWTQSSVGGTMPKAKRTTTSTVQKMQTSTASTDASNNTHKNETKPPVLSNTNIKHEEMCNNDRIHLGSVLKEERNIDCPPSSSGNTGTVMQSASFGFNTQLPVNSRNSVCSCTTAATSTLSTSLTSTSMIDEKASIAAGNNQRHISAVPGGADHPNTSANTSATNTSAANTSAANTSEPVKQRAAQSQTKYSKVDNTTHSTTLHDQVSGTAKRSHPTAAKSSLSALPPKSDPSDFDIDKLLGFTSDFTSTLKTSTGDLSTSGDYSFASDTRNDSTNNKPEFPASLLRAAVPGYVSSSVTEYKDSKPVDVLSATRVSSKSCIESISTCVPSTYCNTVTTSLCTATIHPSVASQGTASLIKTTQVSPTKPKATLVSDIHLSSQQHTVAKPVSLFSKQSETSELLTKSHLSSAEFSTNSLNQQQASCNVQHQQRPQLMLQQQQLLQQQMIARQEEYLAKQKQQAEKQRQEQIIREQELLAKQREKLLAKQEEEKLEQLRRQQDERKREQQLLKQREEQLRKQRELEHRQHQEQMRKLREEALKKEEEIAKRKREEQARKEQLLIQQRQHQQQLQKEQEQQALLEQHLKQQQQQCSMLNSGSQSLSSNFSPDFKQSSKALESSGYNLSMHQRPVQSNSLSSQSQNTSSAYPQNPQSQQPTSSPSHHHNILAPPSHTDLPSHHVGHLQSPPIRGSAISSPPFTMQTPPSPTVRHSSPHAMPRHQYPQSPDGLSPSIGYHSGNSSGLSSATHAMHSVHSMGPSTSVYSSPPQSRPGHASINPYQGSPNKPMPGVSSGSPYGARHGNLYNDQRHGQYS